MMQKNSRLILELPDLKENSCLINNFQIILRVKVILINIVSLLQMQILLACKTFLSELSNNTGWHEEMVF